MRASSAAARVGYESSAPSIPAGTIRPPLWLILSTAALAVLILVLAVAETSLKAAYLVDDKGEFISLFGLAFILVAGLYLASRGRLYGSLPLVLPWLLYPIVTQGDQIIDHLSIDAMRAICHILLAAIFAAPVAVIVMAARYAAPSSLSFVPGLRLLAEGRARLGSAVLAATLLVAEIWLANQYLGTLMIAVLIAMAIGTLVYGCLPEPGPTAVAKRQRRAERVAFLVLIAGVGVSFGTFVGYKNAPGAYQGSPSFFMDPASKDANYSFEKLFVPSGPITVPISAQDAAEALAPAAKAAHRLFDAYHLLNRNYTYDYHNELFLRSTPLVPNYRATGLDIVAEARQIFGDAQARLTAARTSLAADDPLAALLEEVERYLAFHFNRAPVLEEMSAGFEQTKAGLQHAAHLYEGETKYLGSGLAELLDKHKRVLAAPELSGVTGEFARASRAIHAAYAARIVGF